ncbi:hypothetical protein [Pedobacter jeongneungensis]|uniref:hypothetical protein n=1 Tax=Pedobacter jeongneungensis TaxID=947309 RepID=UPI0006911CA3|nr:hypothetical protein [Pedobacter jeongneungensis]
MESNKFISCGFGMLILFSFSAKAQTWSEWFSQKKTQQKYLIEQVAALKLYAGYLKKGYEIGKSGLGFIKDAGKGELDLHRAFFSSLKSVSPAVRNNIKVAEIIQMQIDVSGTLAALSKNSGLSEEHKVYAALVRTELLSDCLADLEELLLIITSGKFELTDDERLLRIDDLHQRIADKRNFAFSFAGSVNRLGAERSRELDVLNRMEGWYEK